MPGPRRRVRPQPKLHLGHRLPWPAKRETRVPWLYGSKHQHPLEAHASPRALGDSRGLQEDADALIRIATEHGFPFWLAMGVGARGAALVAAGRAAEGLALLHESVARHRAIRQEIYLPGALVNCIWG